MTAKKRRNIVTSPNSLTAQRELKAYLERLLRLTDEELRRAVRPRQAQQAGLFDEFKLEDLPLLDKEGNIQGLLITPEMADTSKDAEAVQLGEDCKDLHEQLLERLRHIDPAGNEQPILFE